MLTTRNFGRAEYDSIWQTMRHHVAKRVNDEDADELWIGEHYPVFTTGKAGKDEHLLNLGDIPLVRTDRGGQVTYHGPGQAVVYLMIDMRRLGIGPRELVRRIEQALINYLAEHGVTGDRQAGAPGVYVEGCKIAALGLRISRGVSYHGLALNLDMDLEPFSRINPCGYRGLGVTQLKAFTGRLDIEVERDRLVQWVARSVF
ncbi:MAG: lipoyl(octanoyl) transferase LipB, partial [Pseudomonadota bacterium]